MGRLASKSSRLAGGTKSPDQQIDSSDDSAWKSNEHDHGQRAHDDALKLGELRYAERFAQSNDDHRAHNATRNVVESASYDCGDHAEAILKAKYLRRNDPQIVNGQAPGEACKA